uniref:EXS domain-containing protein n=1 Tax=Rhizophagus irregularis (strain DAOM 181602 / DAOM 197198 / MUCL 43194) TaxID=747089 RepID=U9SQA1_RHIID
MSTIEWNFSNTFPLPYRVLIISVIGLWAWGSNLQILSWLSIDVPHLLDKNNNTPSSHKAIYNLAFIFTSWIGLNLVIFWQVTGGVETEIIEWTSIPLVCYVIVFAIIICPFNCCRKKERMRFLRSDIPLADVIMADILTSFAKVFGDLYATGRILLHCDEVYVGNRGWNYIIAPLFTSIPYVIRFKQCMTEYIGSNRNDKRHLFNAFKYASAFPVILFSVLQKWYKYEALTAQSIVWISHSTLFRLWIISVAFNSMYSFYWDVVMDWKLDFFSPAYPGTLIPGLQLRSNLHFNESFIYYVAIFIDFLLRFTWSLKLSSHLHIIHQLEGGVFLMELLEVMRRWLWIFFRLESAHVEKFDKKGGAYSIVELRDHNSSEIELKE